MKKIFFSGIIGLVLFELLHVFFIMPFPGSQKIESIDLAYFLFSWRWLIRLFFVLLILGSFSKVKWKRKWVPWVTMIFISILVLGINSQISADHMFLQTSNLIMADQNANNVNPGQLVIGIEKNGSAKAYPVQYLGYHHQVLDSLDGKPVMVTYCTVCRTGRVYEPKVHGMYETFRLVGMDHFNAMFEDAGTKSWWRQVNGEAVAGKLKGEYLPELLYTQTSLSNWLIMHPGSLIMQPDSSFLEQYAALEKYESGKSKSSLVGTDSLSWKDKSWVIGIMVGKLAKAYDWNRFENERIIHDKVGDTPVLLVLSSDNKSFFAFARPSDEMQFSMRNDTLFQNGQQYRLDGMGLASNSTLRRLPAYQEFWHSWHTFHAGTEVY